MEIAYLHVVINHLPIMGVPIALGLLLLGLWARDDSIKRAALLAFVVLGLLTVAVFLTGKGGEDFVEHVAGVSEDAIEAHEDMATLAFIAVGVLAVLSLYFFLRHGGYPMLMRRTTSTGTPIPASRQDWAISLSRLVSTTARWLVSRRITSVMLCSPPLASEPVCRTAKITFGFMRES